MAVCGVLLLLAWVIVEDLRRFRIRNGIVLLLVAGFVLACLERDRTDLLVPHALFALVGLLLLVAAFAAGMVGGGDAKLLAAALLWVGPENCLAYALLLLPCALAYAGGAALGLLPARRVGGRLQIPFGPSLAAAWIGVIAWAHLAAAP